MYLYLGNSTISIAIGKNKRRINVNVLFDSFARLKAGERNEESPLYIRPTLITLDINGYSVLVQVLEIKGRL